MRVTVSLHSRLAIILSIIAIVAVVGTVIAGCIVVAREPTIWLGPVGPWHTCAWFAVDTGVTVALAWAAWTMADLIDALRGRQTIKS